MDTLIQLFTRLGRTLEFLLTGQSSFAIHTSEFATAPTIDSSVQARMLQDEVLTKLAEHFDIRLHWPVMLELTRPPALGWKATFYNPEGNMGRYQLRELGPRKGHQVMIVPGLPRPQFAALLAHELVHAYQRERGFLAENPGLREGMAVWVEYHFLRQAGSKQADRLLKRKSFTFGRGMQEILRYEREQGRPATLKWLLSQP